MSDVNFKKCIEEADLVLLTIEQDSFPLNLKKAIETGIKNYNISIVRYSDLTNEDLTNSNMLANVEEMNGKYYIEYNDKILNEGRRRFSICHELGHILLEHNLSLKNDPVQEQEANIFAAELLMPEAIIQEIVYRGYNITNESSLQNIFKASKQAYDIRLQEYANYPDWRKKTIENSSILLQFKGFLDEAFPYKNNYEYCDIDEEENEERARDAWRR